MTDPKLWKVLTTAPPGSPAWLAARKGKIGGHDAAAILGLGRKTPLQVFAELVADEPAPEYEPEENNYGESAPTVSEQMELGTDLEPVVASRYSKRTGRVLLDSPGIVQHPELDWLIASPDRLMAPDAEHPELGVLECKTTGGIREREWLVEPPIEAQIQQHVYFGCLELNRGAIVALVGTFGFKLLYSDTVKNEEFSQWMMNQLVDFREKHWLKDIPPLPRRDDLALIKQMYRKATGTTIKLLPEIEQDYLDLEQVKANLKRLEEHKEGLEVRIRAFMGPNAIGVGRSVSLSLKETHTKERMTHYPANTYRTLRRMK